MRRWLTPSLLSSSLLTPLLLVPHAVAAQAPAAAVAKPADLVGQVKIPYEQFTLPNGLRVIVHTDRKAPVVAVSVWYHVGSKNEPAGKTGYAHLFEHLMFNGSENAPGDFFEPLEQVGATDYNGTTYYDRTNYFETVPTPALARALWLESDRMGHLLGAINQKNLTNQIGVVQNEKRSGDNQPYGLVDYRIGETLYPVGHPYRHSTIGSMTDLSAASMDDVKGWFRNNYGPNNAVLVLAGDVDVATARALTTKYFGDIARGPTPPKVVAPVPTLPARKDEVMHDRVATTRLLRTWAVPGMLDKDAAALDVVGGVLGGLASSRLDNILVRGEKLAVAVSASYSGFEDAGQFSVSMDVRPGVDPAVAAKRLDAIIADFVRTGPTADEVSRYVTTTAARQIKGLESVGGFGGKAVALAEGAVYANDPGFYAKQLAALAAVTPAQAQAVAQKWLSRPVYALSIVPGARENYVEAAPVAVKTDDAATTAAAGPVGRGGLPTVGTIKELEFPAVQRATLSNGMQVVYAQRTAVPVTKVAISFDAGNAADPKAKLGTQSLMLALLDEGTETRNSIQIAEAQERLGANIGARASMDRTTVSLDALTANLAPSLDLMQDIVRNPAFAPAEVDRLRNTQLARIASELTQPQGVALRTLPAVLYGPNHPYAVPFSGTGDPAVVARLTPADMAAFHRAWIRPDGAKIFVVSSAPLASVQTMLEQSFGSWRAPAVPRVTKDLSAPTPAPRGRILLIDRPQSPQSLIVGGAVLGYKGTDDLTRLEVANDVLGGSFLSRLNTDLRETKGWSYGVSGSVSRLLGPVPYLVSAPVQTDRTGASIVALKADMAAFLTKDGVTKAELERTVNGRVRELAGTFEGSGDVLGGLQRIDLYGWRDDHYQRLAAQYRALTAPQLDAAARAALDPAKIVWIVVGDAAKVRPQLAETGLPVEVVPAAVAVE
ncbi:M16 family metallopeptidase [Sphingomonas prati]|uniref:Putative Zn-dependent peptidase n=1 Tax=Sphingomonas prati TaxID=1843237 RepID=A0A7W9F0Z4_9SPHN|nr:pitrilysin family protein [Sphingomonas prati]MBB5728776.1 putative Zn-dependent peptidase [Sphingomonas prati]GGE87670.1 zinc protease [Sphingomonas prati]